MHHTLRALKKRLARRCVITRFDGRRKMSWESERFLRDRYGADSCKSRIAEHVSIAESPSRSCNIFKHVPATTVDFAPTKPPPGMIHSEIRLDRDLNMANGFSLTLSHVGYFVTDNSEMVGFYTRFLKIVVSDHGE